MKQPTEHLPDIAYSIPYEWGQLSVSEAADEAYGLTPFAVTVEGSNIDDAPRPKDGPAAYLTLLAPDEYGFDPVTPVKRPGKQPVANLSFSLPTTRRYMTLELEDHIEFMLENSSEAVEVDKLKNAIPQQLAHLMSSHAGSKVSEAITDWNIGAYAGAPLGTLALLSY